MASAPVLTAPVERRAARESPTDIAPRVVGARTTFLRAVFVGGATLTAAAIGSVCLGLALMLHLGMAWCAGVPCDSIQPYLPVIAFAALTRGGLFLAGGHHRNRRSRGWEDEVVDAVREAGLGSLAIVVFTFFYRGGTRFGTFSYSRSVFLLDWLIATVLLVVLLLTVKRSLASLRQRGRNVRHVAVVGTSRTARSFVHSMASHPETGYRVVAEIDRGDPAEDLAERLLDVARQRHVDEVVLATPSLDRRDVSRLVGHPELKHVRVRAVPELFGLPPTKVALEAAGPFPLLSLLNEPLPGARRALKRAIDLAVAGTALVVTGPILLIAAVAVRAGSSGPVLFRQQRVGMDGRPFRMLKLRTMYDDCDAALHERYVTALLQGNGERHRNGSTSLYKLVNDPRVTPIGRLLRRLSIDELPQLFNVLKGDMSVVGPRPALPFEVELYADWQRRRLDVRPGMTGLWQVSGRSKLSYEEMVRLDIAYAETWSPVRDLAIVLRTLPALFRREAS